MVKNPPAMWDSWVRFPGWEDPLEEGMATHSRCHSCLKNPMNKGAWHAAVYGVEESNMTE